MTSTLTIKTDAQLKEDAKAYFASLGLNLSGAINLFLRDAVQNQRLNINVQEQAGTLYPLSKDDLTPQQSQNIWDQVDRDNYTSYIPSV